MRAKFFTLLNNIFKHINQKNVFIFLGLILAIVLFLSIKLCNNSLENFCYGFLGNLFSDAIIFIVFGFLLVRYLENKNQPRPLVVANNSPTEIIIKNSELKNDKFKIQFSIFNTGNRTLTKDNSYYHILIPKILFPKVKGNTKERITDTELFYDFNNMIRIPCLPYRHTDILTVECKYVDTRVFRGLRNLKILYFISTEFGLFPKTIKLMDNTNPDPNTLGAIKLRFI